MPASPAGSVLQLIFYPSIELQLESGWTRGSSFLFAGKWPSATLKGPAGTFYPVPH